MKSMSILCQSGEFERSGASRGSAGRWAPTWALSLLAIGGLASQARAADIDVPGDQPTIQQGIDASSNGDRVLVAPGQYDERIDFHGKDIELIGTGGPAVTAINGKHFGPVVSFQTNENSHAVLTGFTITNAQNRDFHGEGGGIYVKYGASPTIFGNEIVKNAACRGAGMYVAGSAHIHDNTFRANKALCRGRRGGGIYVEYYAGPLVEHNTLEDNEAEEGGGIYIDGTYYIPDSEATRLYANVMRGNQAWWGGGLFVVAHLVDIADNVIVRNKATREGGGVYGVAQHDGAKLDFVNNTVADNGGGGVWFGTRGDGAVRVVNNVIFSSDGIAANCTSDTGHVAFADDLVYSTSGGDFGGTCDKSRGGIVEKNPEIVGGAGKHRYWLSSNSPAIDAGDTKAAGVKRDASGAPRVVGPAVDLGAYEYRGE